MNISFQAMVELSAAAISEVKRLRLKQESSITGRLRIRVEESGCSGLSYQMEFEKEPFSGDRVFASDDLDVVIDSTSLSYLDGVVIDYTEDLMGGSFQFNNPNAVEVCNCGNSFKIKTQADALTSAGL